MELLKYTVLFVLGALTETLLHVNLKKAATYEVEKSKFKYYLAIFTNRYFLIAMVFYLSDLVIYMYLLANLPLSITYPITGLQKIFIILYSRFLLKENITKIEYLGITLIQIGILLIAGSRGYNG